MSAVSAWRAGSSSPSVTIETKARGDSIASPASIVWCTRSSADDQLAALVLSIAAINSWNRLNVATRQITGEWVEQLVAAQIG